MKIPDSVKQRLKQKRTWLGIAGIISLLGYTITPTEFELIWPIIQTIAELAL